MPAYSETFPWPSHYRHFTFFEHRMTEHSMVRTLKNVGDGIYHLTLSSDRNIIVFICECYSYGFAEYIETIEKIGKVDAVIINSNWCGYTDQLKLQCRKERVGIFNIRDFMAAINKNEFWTYLNEYDKKRYKEKGLL